MSATPDREDRVAGPVHPDPECGEPGGGRGRRDETGRTGIWPMSGPLPPSADARTVSQGGLGQGDRAAIVDDAAGCRTDPVCGSPVHPARATASVDWNGTTYFFDSPECGRRFAAAPARYTVVPAHPSDPSPWAPPSAAF